MLNTTLSPEEGEFRRGLEMCKESLRRFMLLKGIDISSPPEEDDCPPPIIVEDK